MSCKDDKALVVAIIEPVCAHGGMDYYDYALISALVKTGIQPRLYTSMAGPLALKEIPILETFRGVFGKAPRLYRAIKWILALLHTLNDAMNSNVSLVHYHFFDTGLLERMGVWFARKYNMKVIATIHDVEPFHDTRTVSDALSLLSALDGIIVHNETSRIAVKRILGERHHNIEVIPHGNYLGHIGALPLQSDARRRLDLPLDRPMFLLFGQIKKVKGLDIAIKALAVAKNTMPDVLLLIAGKPWKDERSSYNNLVQTLGLESNVIWHDKYIQPQHVDYYYAACDAVVLPYKRIYQSGVLLMAMSYGVPVIVSDLPGMIEVVTHQKNGLVFRAGDHRELAACMERIISDTELAASVAKSGRAHVAYNNDWVSIGMKTKRFYMNVGAL